MKIWICEDMDLSRYAGHDARSVGFSRVLLVTKPMRDWSVYSIVPKSSRRWDAFRSAFLQEAPFCRGQVPYQGKEVSLSKFKGEAPGVIRMSSRDKVWSRFWAPTRGRGREGARAFETTKGPGERHQVRKLQEARRGHTWPPS